MVKQLRKLSGRLPARPIWRKENITGSVAQSVEQRPFKALVLGSSPSRPILLMAWVYILRGESGRHYIGSTDDLRRRLAEHQRGGNHTTRRLGNEVELVASRQLLTMAEARALELKLKRKKNPQVAMFVLQSSPSH